MTNTYQDLGLTEWIRIGQRLGKIRDGATVSLAFAMSEPEAMAWISDIVTGRTSEQEAQVFMQRVVQYSMVHC